MSDPTPRPWPAGTMPTAAQLLAWVREARDDEVLLLLDRALEDSLTAHRCRISEHDLGLEELTRAQLDRARWHVIRDHVEQHRPTDPTARRVRELMGEDHREDPTP